MTGSDDKKDYEVGYKKPPKSHQFKPGQSGNPRGRRKGLKNLKTDLHEELSEQVQVTEGGRTQKISKQRAAIKSLSAKAMNGDSKALQILLTLVDRLLDPGRDEGDEIPKISIDDEAILAAFVAKQAKAGDHSGGES